MPKFVKIFDNNITAGDTEELSFRPDGKDTEAIGFVCSSKTEVSLYLDNDRHLLCHQFKPGGLAGRSNGKPFYFLPVKLKENHIFGTVRNTHTGTRQCIVHLLVR
ncbi:MAG: hypothetical protein KJ607_03190 [Bacteroidetes bacterium]|nr:hypothetical protein [Bacteroidota bacterium]